MNHLFFYIHGNLDHHNDTLDILTHFLALFEGVTNDHAIIWLTFLPGISNLANIHPLLVHFPIAFLSFFVIIEFLGTATKKMAWRNFASGLLYLGTALTSLTVLAGIYAANTVSHGQNVHNIMERHEQFGFAIFMLSISLTAWRLRRQPEGWGIYSLFSLLLFGLLILGADLGGLMVYKYGVAVETSAVLVEGNHHH